MMLAVSCFPRDAALPTYVSNGALNLRLVVRCVLVFIDDPFREGKLDELRGRADFPC